MESSDCCGEKHVGLRNPLVGYREGWGPEESLLCYGDLILALFDSDVGAVKIIVYRNILFARRDVNSTIVTS